MRLLGRYLRPEPTTGQVITGLESSWQFLQPVRGVFPFLSTRLRSTRRPRRRSDWLGRTRRERSRSGRRRDHLRRRGAEG